MQALTGVKVLDLSRILTGPYCTMMLADLGAEVIKVEPPGGDDTRQWGPPFVAGESTYFLSVNRNKKSIMLNLRSEDGRDVLLRLVRWADILVENFRPGTMERLGLGQEFLRRLNPGLIYCAITGFGLDGPACDRPGYDLLAQALGGMMAVTGTEAGETVKAGMSVADIGAGMFAAFGILAALRHRDQTGEGQVVDTSLLETMLAWHTYHATAYWVSGQLPKPMGTAHPSLAPYQAVQALDGAIIIAVGNDGLWQKFCDAIGLEHLADDTRYRTNPDRVKHRLELIAAIEAHFAPKPVAYWTEVLGAAGVPAGPIQNYAEIYRDPHVLHRQMVTEVEHAAAGTIKLPGIPIKLSATPGRVQTAPPRLGEHTGEVLADLGYTDDEVQSLRRAGVFGNLDRG